MKDADRKLFVIVDNLRVHKDKVVTAWVAENTDRIKVFPDYAPCSADSAVVQLLGCGGLTRGWPMERNSVQFQKGLSEAEFDRRYGTEAQCREVVIAARWPRFK